jgi:hypothetical protein
MNLSDAAGRNCVLPEICLFNEFAGPKIGRVVLNPKRGAVPMLSQNKIRWILGLLLAFVALNAFAGGYYGMSGARNVPTEWLQGVEGSSRPKTAGRRKREHRWDPEKRKSH